MNIRTACLCLIAALLLCSVAPYDASATKLVNRYPKNQPHYIRQRNLGAVLIHYDSDACVEWLAAEDVDVSWDLVHWFHLLGVACKDNLKSAVKENSYSSNNPPASSP